MMVTFVNQSSSPLPRSFVQRWLLVMRSAIPQHVRYRQTILRKKKLAKMELTVVYLDPPAARQLNFQYRQKDYATDVLSFGDKSSDSLGELVICPQVLKKQAKDHGLSYQQELAYMILHGVLHLLGYDHETNERQAKLMFAIQDDIFAKNMKKLSR